MNMSVMGAALELWVRFKPLVVFLLTVQRPFLYFSCSLFVFMWHLFISYPFIFQCLGKAVLCDCGISWVSLLLHHNLFIVVGSNAKQSL